MELGWGRLWRSGLGVAGSGSGLVLGGGVSAGRGMAGSGGLLVGELGVGLLGV